MIQKKILVVEDNLNLARMLQSLLVQRGYWVATAEKGEEGIQMAKTFSPDLILMDLKMPDLAGDVTALRIKSEEENRNIPIIALSAYNDPLTRATTRTMGFNDHIAKPFDTDDLVWRIEKALLPVSS